MFRNEDSLTYWHEAFENGRRMTIRAQSEVIQRLSEEALRNVVFVDFSEPEDAA